VNTYEQRWPLHPQPREWEGLETWARRVAAAYGMHFAQFVRSGLGRRGPGAWKLDTAPDTDLGVLSRGTGVPLERVRSMATFEMLRRAAVGPGWMLTADGRAALDEFNASARRLAHRLPAGPLRVGRPREPGSLGSK
jgi:hypothetical protein